MRLILAVLCALCLSGCADTGPTPEQIEQKAEIEQSNNACVQKYPFGMARVKCLNDVLDRLIKPHFPFPDLLSLEEAQRIVVMEKFEKREITEAEAKAAFAKILSDEIGEYNRRSAQQASLNMQRDALFMMSRPVTCIPGAVVNCF